MSEMLLNIERVVDNLKNIKINNIFFEAIANSIQAKATKIDIKIYSSSLYEKTEKIPPYIDRMEIIDNGEGFNEENLKSFKEYGSKHKISLGCKGVGRFVYLKLFKHIDVKSKDIEFSFNVNGVEKERKVSNSETKILFSNPKGNINADFNSFEQAIREHFLAYFLMYKDAKQIIEIKIYNNDKLKCDISSNQIPTFKKKKFCIRKYEFTLTYVYGNQELKNEGYYVADKRVVSKNSALENEKKYNLLKDNELKIYFILESEYFNKKVDNERNKLLIYPKRKSDELQFRDLCWEDIHNELDIQLKEIYKENGFDIDKTIKKYRKEAIENFPYLGAYFDNSNELSLEQMEKNAKKEFENDKIFLRNKDNKRDKDYEVKLSKVTQAELAEYIFDRGRLLQQLRESVKKGDIEEKVHNLFMPKKTFDDKQNYKTNNVWLFDDRFMSYDKIFSDIQIKDIFPELHQNIERPDILSIISNTYNKDKITDVLLVEFKRPDNKITPARAEEQLLKYGRYINSKFDEKIRIWAYAFLKFDDDVMGNLQDKSYNRIFTHNKYPLCYKYYESNNMIVNFLDYEALICDAENRNKLFLDILKGRYLDNE